MFVARARRSNISSTRLRAGTPSCSVGARQRRPPTSATSSTGYLTLDGGPLPRRRRTRLIGAALPILAASDNLAIHYALDDARDPGDVLVMKPAKATSAAPSSAASSVIIVTKGVLGAIVDGVIRDAETLSSKA